MTIAWPCVTPESTATAAWQDDPARTLRSSRSRGTPESETQLLGSNHVHARAGSPSRIVRWLTICDRGWVPTARMRAWVGVGPRRKTLPETATRRCTSTAPGFNKPGTIPLSLQTEVRDGCPLDCGSCPEHRQHACLGIIEVNPNCNLDCPICFADSGHQPDGYAITVEQCARIAGRAHRRGGRAGGGDVPRRRADHPQAHPDVHRPGAGRPIRAVNLNTNGIRLADRQFVAALGERNRPGRPVNVYLQFDGFEQRTHREIVGATCARSSSGRCRADSHSGRSGGAGPERARAWRHRAPRADPSGRTIRSVPAGHALRSACAVRPAHSG